MSSETPSPKDLFSVCKENVDNFFNEVEKSTPMYQKSIADLQQKYIDAWKIAIYSAIDVQKEYANKNGLNFNIPEATMRMIRDNTVAAIKHMQIRIRFQQAPLTQQLKPSRHSMLIQNRLLH